MQSNELVRIMFHAPSDHLRKMLTEYLWRIGSDLGGLGVVAGSKQVVELACKELFSSGQVVADGQAKSQIWILEHVRDVWDDVLLFHADRQHLCFRGKK